MNKHILSGRLGSQLRRSTARNRAGRTKPTVDKKYVVGLTDGEGCFYIVVRNSPAYRAGAMIGLHFHIKMQKADRELLVKVKNTLGCGGVYFQNEKRLNHTQCYRYTVSSNADIITKIIPFFETYPLESYSKLKNFELFRRAAIIVAKGQHLSKKGVDEIRSLKSQMNKKTVGLA